MSLWEKKDRLYVEASTINVYNFCFYDYHSGYTVFSQSEPSSKEVYICDDTDENNILFNYTSKEAEWCTYKADEMDEELFQVFDEYIDYDSGKDDPEDGKTFTFNELRSVLVASSGGGGTECIIISN